MKKVNKNGFPPVRVTPFYVERSIKKKKKKTKKKKPYFTNFPWEKMFIIYCGFSIFFNNPSTKKCDLKEILTKVVDFLLVSFGKEWTNCSLK